MKGDLGDWAEHNRDQLARHVVYATGTTGGILAERLGLPVHRFLSGPLGGDQQIGAAIAEGRIDPTACNRSTADFLISSPLFAAAEAA